MTKSTPWSTYTDTLFKLYALSLLPWWLLISRTVSSIVGSDLVYHRPPRQPFAVVSLGRMNIQGMFRMLLIYHAVLFHYINKIFVTPRVKE